LAAWHNGPVRAGNGACDRTSPCPGNTAGHAGDTTGSDTTGSNASSRDPARRNPGTGGPGSSNTAISGSEIRINEQPASNGGLLFCG
jgi:hypothetical protein